MPLDNGYFYLTLDSYTFPTNPTEYLDPRAEKKFVDVVTLTATITQHWNVLDSDKTCWMSWKNISKTMKDTLETKYNADYTSYVFTDLYGNSYNVVIVEFIYRRRTTIDDDGYEAEMLLKVV